jgi:Na+-transporting NADH:ubiquinone oxidoreductase subunit A
MRTGKVDLTRRIAVAGSQVKQPAYLQVMLGAPMADILAGQLAATDHVRIIDGNPLVGKKSSLEAFLGAPIRANTYIHTPEKMHALRDMINDMIKAKL